MNRQLYLSAFVLVLTAPMSGWAQGAPSVTPDIAQRIDALFAPWDSTRSPGCAIGVSRNGDVVYSRGYGMANLEHGVPITPDSVFDVASTSKQFTAFSIALLASDGRLSLDEDIRRYLPELPEYEQRITIRHLLTHTSGLRNTGDLFDLAGWRVSQRDPASASAPSPLQEPVTENDVLRMAARQRSLDFVPGSEYLYNNSAYTLLAVIVKRVAGLSLREFTEARIFAPLGMDATQFRDDPNVIRRRRTSAYRTRPGGGWWISSPLSTIVGPWGLETTVGDLLKWARNLVDARVGGRPLLHEMQTSGRLNDGTSTGYGFGLFVGDEGQMRRVGHAGGDFGYRAEFVQYYAIRDRAQHVTVATLCNGRSIPAQSLTRRVVEIVLGPDALAPLDPVAPPAAAVAVAVTELTALAGTYWSPTGGPLRLVIKDGKLIPEGASVAYVPLGNGRFRVGDMPIEALFLPTRTGQPQELHIRRLMASPARTVVFARVTTTPFSAADLESFAGQYRSDELAATYTITVTPEGGLAVVREKVEPVPLTRITRDIFFGQSLGLSVTFVRAPAGEVRGLTIAAPTPRRLTFTRIGSARAPGNGMRLNSGRVPESQPGNR